MISHYSTALTRQELKKYFLAGCKKENELAIGVEWEKIGIDRDSGEAIRYSGPRGVHAILGGLVDRYDWQPLHASNGLPIALKKGPASITLEPGGQIELWRRRFPLLSPIFGFDRDKARARFNRAAVFDRHENTPSSLPGSIRQSIL